MPDDRGAPVGSAASPADWPSSHTDSQGFLKTLARLADRQIRRPNWQRFGGLFTALGIPEDALLGLADRIPRWRGGRTACSTRTCTGTT